MRDADWNNMTRARAQLLPSAFKRRELRRACLALLLLCIVPRLPHAAALEIGPVPGIVGSRFEYAVRKGDTLTAVSARYAVSEKALIRDNGLHAPYRLRPGDRLQVHDRHLVPGDPPADGIVINLPQRVLFVFRGGVLAGAYPVAAGKPTWKTPTGSYAIRTMEQDKPWIVPPSIQAEMRAEGKPVLTRVEPGPDNPLGRYWLGLTLAGYGIHGTNAPSSIYYLRTHGCIRVHPDDMETLYGQVMLRMPVRIIYAHTLIARLADGRIVAEVNPDFYGRGGDPLQLLRDMAYKEDLEAAIDWTVAARVAKARIGQAHEIGRADAESSRAGAAKGHELAVSRIGDWSAGCERGAR
jgi:L,D-transpeptidase ErfK/SrfK